MSRRPASGSGAVPHTGVMDEQPWPVRLMAALVERWDEFVTTDSFRVHHRLWHPEIARNGAVVGFLATGWVLARSDDASAASFGWDPGRASCKLLE